MFQLTNTTVGGNPKKPSKSNSTTKNDKKIIVEKTKLLAQPNIIVKECGGSTKLIFPPNQIKINCPGCCEGGGYGVPVLHTCTYPCPPFANGYSPGACLECVRIIDITKIGGPLLLKIIWPGGGLYWLAGSYTTSTNSNGSTDISFTPNGGTDGYALDPNDPDLN